MIGVITRIYEYEISVACLKLLNHNNQQNYNYAYYLYICDVVAFGNYAAPGVIDKISDEEIFVEREQQVLFMCLLYCYC